MLTRIRRTLILLAQVALKLCNQRQQGYQLLQATSAYDAISAQSRFEHVLSLQHEASQHVRAESMHANYYNVD